MRILRTMVAAALLAAPFIAYTFQLPHLQRLKMPPRTTHRFCGKPTPS